MHCGTPRMANNSANVSITSSLVMLRSTHQNDVWCWDFVFDRTTGGKRAEVALDRRRVHAGVFWH
jgi:hypothetical protein